LVEGNSPVGREGGKSFKKRERRRKNNKKLLHTKFGIRKMNYHDAGFVRLLSNWNTLEDSDRTRLIKTLDSLAELRGPKKLGTFQPLPFHAEELITTWLEVREKLERREAKQPLIDEIFPPTRDGGERSFIISEMKRVQKEIDEDPSQKELDGRVVQLEKLAAQLAIETVFEADKCGKVCQCLECKEMQEWMPKENPKKKRKAPSLLSPEKKLPKEEKLMKFHLTPNSPTGFRFFEFEEEQDYFVLNNIFDEGQFGQVVLSSNFKTQ